MAPTMETMVQMSWCDQSDHVSCDRSEHVTCDKGDHVPCGTNNCTSSVNCKSTAEGTNRYSGANNCNKNYSCGSEDAFIQQRPCNGSNKTSPPGKGSNVLYVELVRSQLALRAPPRRRRLTSSGSSFLSGGGSPLVQQIWTLVLLVWVLALVLICDMVTYGPPGLGGGSTDVGEEGSDLGNVVESVDLGPAEGEGIVQHIPGPRPVVAPPPPVAASIFTQEVQVSRLLRVEVYYEALCPDSRSFVMKQLIPAYTALSEVMDVHMVPYGKAKTTKGSSGKLGFSCQHGPTECEANKVHACVSNVIKDKDKVLNIINCMIDRNSNPLKIGQFCVEKYGEAWSDVEKCLKSDKGDLILKHMGELTHSLNPAVSFIPTITIDGSQEEQRLILRSFQKVLCNRYKGEKPDNCP